MQYITPKKIVETTKWTLFYLIYGSMFTIATIITFAVSKSWILAVAMGFTCMIIFESLKN